MVGSACTPWVRPMQGVCRNSSARRRSTLAHARDARAQELARIADLERERGVERVARGHPEVQPARRLAHRLRDLREERDHVVAHLALDLGHARDVDARAGAQLGGGRAGITPRAASSSETASSTSSQRW